LVNKNEEAKGEITLTAKKKNINASLLTDYYFKFNKTDSTIVFNPSEFLFAEKNKTVTSSFAVKANGLSKYRFAARDNDLRYFSSTKMREIKYDHIPYINYMVVPEVTFAKIDVKIYNKRIGYIIGAGDKVPEALDQMGYEVTLIGDKELSRNNLQQFDAIITGVRAYNTNDWMNKYYDKLMKYVNEGGNLIVQYNNTQFRGGQPKIGPYNFTIANKRITDENADVVFLKPEHPVMNFPNKITQDDFKAWIQERSIYHATNFDKTNFETIFSMHDPGEASDDGSLIISKYGKGYFTYTCLVFFRELPAGVPGAYRLLANIIALNKKKAF
jgi:hypothetical protein